MNLVLATFPPLLLLAPIPVQSQWLCQYEHVRSHRFNQQEEVPGLKIITSLDLRAAPLADDTTDGSTDIGKPGHSHWGHMAVGMNCWKSHPLVSGADTGKNVLSNYQQCQGTCARTEGRTETNCPVCQIHALYIHTVTLLPLVTRALAQIKRKKSSYIESKVIQPPG